MKLGFSRFLAPTYLGSNTAKIAVIQAEQKLKTLGKKFTDCICREKYNSLASKATII